MKNGVVKNFRVIDFYKLFNSFINDSSIFPTIRIRKEDFTRDRELTAFKLLFYLIFRNGKTINQDLIKFYNLLDIPELIVSKQALSKALRKINPKVFEHLFAKFSSSFYKSDLVKTYHGYIVLAEDGSTVEAPLSDASLDYFGFSANQYIKEKKDAKKVSAKVGGLFDLTNGFFPSITIGKHNDSELPLAFSNLENVMSSLEDRKAIYLADRYYGSVELFPFFELYHKNYCIRAKSNFYKDQVALIDEDGWIDLMIDNTWLHRFKREDTKKFTSHYPSVRIRVIKHTLAHPNDNGETQHIYFTNLSEDEFSKDEIAKLYSFRWDIETQYKYLKVDLESERFNTTSPYVFMCKFLGKVMMINLIGILMSEVNMEVREKSTATHHLYGFKTKFCNLKDFFYESKLLYFIYYDTLPGLSHIVKVITENSKKRIVPIRPDRHYKRYGRFLKSPPNYRFSKDGRNQPKTRKVQGGLATVRP